MAVISCKPAPAAKVGRWQPGKPADVNRIRAQFTMLHENNVE